MFESLKPLLEIIGWLAYLIGGIACLLIVSFALAAIAPFNMVVASLWWLPLLFYLTKEENRRAIAEALKYWAGKPISEERKKKILEDIEKELKKTKQS